MKRLLAASAVAMFLSLGVAQAHTHLESSMPADGAVVAAAPGEIMLHFSEATRLTSLTLHKEGDKEPKSVAALPKTASKAVTVPVAGLTAGKYQVQWRAIGGDNHVMTGKLQFTVQGK